MAEIEVVREATSEVPPEVKNAVVVLRKYMADPEKLARLKNQLATAKAQLDEAKQTVDDMKGKVRKLEHEVERMEERSELINNIEKGEEDEG
jgi:predicted  nucleic acid-binding Zn-ribbon protein